MAAWHCHKGPFSWRGLVLTSTACAVIGPLLDLVLADSVPPARLLIDFGVGVVFSNLIAGLSASFGMLLMPWLRTKRPAAQVAVIGASLVSAGLVGSLFATAIVYPTGIFGHAGFWPTYFQALRYAMFITLTFGAGATAFEILRRRLQVTTLELRTQQLERARAEQLAAEAQLASLESRVHPHFLFNALNSISSLIREDPDLAERLVGRMAALLRFSLDTARLRVVPLGQEIKIVTDYLEIEKARFGERLRYSIQVSPELDAVEIPPLSVQTVVENSIKYAVGPRREGALIRISAAASDEAVEVSVSDDGAGFQPDDLKPGHGLENLMARLHTMYGSKACLEMVRAPQGMTVKVRVPVQGRAAVA